MANDNWIPFISVSVPIMVLFISFVGGYAVLRKRVNDLEEEGNEKLDKDKHDDLCQIATLEMKKHVSDSMSETMKEFDAEKFQPALKSILKAIDGKVNTVVGD